MSIDKVGPMTAQKITTTIAGAADPFEALSSYPAGKSWKRGFAELNRLFDDLRTAEPRPGLLCEIALKWYQPVFERLYADDYPKRQKDLEQLKTIISSYEDLQSFIDDTTLDPPESDLNAYSSDLDTLVLSTIHSAKGLEWEAVFVIGLADGRFPHSSAFPGEQWEEERRLLYVAATRARTHLFLTYPRELMSPDRRFMRVGMSPFLAELEPGGYELVKFSPGDTPRYGSAASGSPLRGRSTPKKNTKKAVLEDFARGCRVKHPFFGTGTVHKKTPPRSLDVAFDRHGMKTLHLDYARLIIVDS